MELYYKQYGEGHPLVILHGLLGSSGNWHSLASKHLAEHFAVYAVDQRNHGCSPHADSMDYPAMAEDLRDFMDGLELQAVRLLGHSMGGKTAMEFALAYPERVERLVVVDIAPKSYPPNHVALLKAMRSLDLSAFGSRQEVDEALGQKVPSAPIRQFLLKNLSLDKEAGTYEWQVNLDAISEHYGQLNEAIASDRSFDGPVLFIRGANSDYIRAEDQKQIRQLFPRAEITTLPKAGHWVHADAPEAFAEMVLAFLRP